MWKKSLNEFQKRFWIEEKMNRDSRNNVGKVFKIEGEFKPGVFEKALLALADRFQILSSVVCEERDGGVWIPVREASGFIIFEDYTGDGKSGEAEKRITEFCRYRFDLYTERSLRILVLQKESREWYIVFLFHHICIDWLSLGEFLRLTGVYYQTVLAGISLDEFVEIKDLPNDCITCEMPESARTYWLDFFNGRAKEIIFPGFSGYRDNDRPGDSLDFELGLELSRAIKQLAASEKTTCFRILSVVWLWALSRFSHNNEVVTSYTVNLRPKEFDGQLGPFINNLPFFLDFTEQKSFREYLEILSAQRREQKKFQSGVFTGLVSLLRKEHLLNAGDGFLNTCINYISRNELLYLDLAATRSCFYKDIVPVSGFDLLFEADDAETCRCRIVYGASFPSEFVVGMKDAILTVLRAVSANPGVVLHSVCLIPDEKLECWINRGKGISSDLSFCKTTFPAFFSGIVERHRERTALIYGKEHYTYGDLDEWSEAIAGYIRRMADEKECSAKSPVGVLLDRGAGMIAGIIGILKSGTAYVPLDPGNPDERLQFILDDCAIKLVLTSGDLRHRICGGIETLLLEKAGKSAGISQQCAAVPEDWAYVIYTSGTTGQPKGIPIAHFRLMHMLRELSQAYGVTEQDVILQFASINFDASVVDIFLTLSVGASLVVASHEERRSPGRLLKLLEQEKVTCATIPPAFLSVMETQELPDLDLLVVAGDTTPVETLSRWGKGRRLINAYGPTENTVCTTLCALSDSSPAYDIGGTLKNVSCYVLDEALLPVPDGVLGELCIGGIQLTEGYINLQELNREKFIANPFVSAEDNERGTNLRLYRSGDLVRRLYNGHLEFFGRTDFQVKIRGLRIETGEIESWICKFPGVVQALVMMRETDGQKNLIAYFQVEDVLCFSLAGLKEFLRKHIPGYMCPAFLIPLNKFPLNMNGKIDRKALPEAGYEKKECVREEKTLLTLAERCLARLWEECLGVTPVGREDHFFYLGGDSIQAIRLALRIEEEFKVDFGVADIFTYPVLAEQALRIAAGNTGYDLQNMNISNYLALSPVQLNLWTVCKLSPVFSAAYHVPLVVHLTGDLDSGVLEKAVNLLLMKAEGLRMYFPAGETGIPCIRTGEFGNLPLCVEEVADPGKVTEKLISLGFDLEKGPLYRIVLLKCGENNYQLICVFHHLIVDGWSVGWMLGKLSEMYNDGCNGRTIDLPDQSYSFMDYARRENLFSESREFKQQYFFWQNYLADCPPLDFGRETGRISGQGHILFEVSEEQLRNIQDFCIPQGITLFTYLLDAWQRTIACYTNADDFITGIVSAGRDDCRFREVVGYFVHLLPVRAISGSYGHNTERLKQLSKDLAGVYAHERVSLDKILERRLKINNVFILQPEIPEIFLQGLICRINTPVVPYAKFDLVLELNRKGGRLSGSLGYATDIFECGVVERIKDEFLLQAVRTLEDTGEMLAAEGECAEEKWLASIVCKLLKKSKVSVAENLFEAGLSSLGAIILVTQAEKAGIPVSVSDVYAGKTIREIVKARKSLWYRWYREEDCGKPVVVLVCGDPFFDTFYKEFAELLSVTYSLFIIESYHLMPGYCQCSFNELVDRYIDYIKTNLIGKTIFAFSGFCVGGELALSIAGSWYKQSGIRAEVWMMDSFVRGTEEKPVYCLDEKNEKRNMTNQRLIATEKLEFYPGKVSLILASRLASELPDVDIPESQMQYLSDDFQKNRINWKKLIPHIIIHFIDCTHLTFFRDGNPAEIINLLTNE